MDFPLQIKIFLAQVGIDLTSKGDDPQSHADKRISTVPRSRSAGTINDIMIFKYRKKGAAEDSEPVARVLILRKPITKRAKTGSYLLTGVYLPIPGNYTPQDLEQAFTGQIPEDAYRTFIMGNIDGPLYRVR